MLLILLFIILGCSNKEQIKVKYPYIEFFSFEKITDINKKVFEATGKGCSIVDDLGNKSCDFNYINNDSIRTHCHLKFNNREELIWFQCWYTILNDDLDYLHSWFNNYYQLDTIQETVDDIIEIKKESEPYVFQISTSKSKVLYVGQFFTDEIPNPD